MAARTLAPLSLLLLPLLLMSGCRPQAQTSSVPKVSVPTKAKAVDAIGLLRGRQIGAPVMGKPWVAHVLPVDLDRDGRVDVVACEAQESRVYWLRQDGAGQFSEQVLAGGMRAPVHVEAEDLDGDGDLDLLVSSMGEVFPNNDKIGSVIILENDGTQRFRPRIIEKGVV